MLSRREMLMSAGPSLLGVPVQAVGAVQKLPEAGKLILDIEQFGGIANGPDDNTAAILRALAYIRKIGSGVLRFSAGVYRFSHVTFDIDNLDIVGMGSTLLSTLPKNTDTAALWIRGDKIRISNLTLDYEIPVSMESTDDLNARGKNGYGIRVGGRGGRESYIATEICLSHVAVRNARNGGISIYKAQVVNVSDCVVARCLGNGIGFDGCVGQIVASRNVVEDTGDDMLVIATDNSVANGTESAIVSNNILRKGFAKGIATTGVDRIIINANIVEQTFAGGIAIIEDTFYKLGKSKNVLITGNYVFEAGTRFGDELYKKKPSNVGHSIYVSSGASNIRIANNMVSAGRMCGIRINSCEVIGINSNSIDSHQGVAISLGDNDSSADPSVHNFTVVHNQVSMNHPAPAIDAGGGRAGCISGNIVSYSLNTDERVSAIQCGLMRGVLVIDNVVDRNGSNVEMLRLLPDFEVPAPSAQGNISI